MALILSAAFERYRLTLAAATGIACILAGNALVLLRKRRVAATGPIPDIEASAKNAD